MTLLAAVETTGLKWRALPPLWVVVLVLVPAVFLTVRFVYKREAGKLSVRPRQLLGVLRALVILLILGALFGPFAETVEGEYFKRHLVICLDTSQSMSFSDAYLKSDYRETVREAAGLAPGESPAGKPRLELAKSVLLHDRKFLAELASKFRLHLFTFDSTLAGLVQPQEGESPADQAARIATEVAPLRAEGSVTRIGSAIRDLVRAFDSRNEPVAGILLFTDGRHTGGAPEPVEEARRAAQGTREGIAIFPVAIGDPGAAMNVGVSRVDAPEVVLAGDEVSFTISVHARGFPPGRSVYPEALVLAPDGSVQESLPIDAAPFDLPGEEETAEVTLRYRFTQPGTYDLKVGVPSQPGEAVLDDNHQRHPLRVAQLKMRVLLVAGQPTPEYRFLSQALLRAEETIAANIILLSAESAWPQEASRGLEPIRTFPQDKAALGPYDVIILQDVNPRSPGVAPGGDHDPEHVLTLLEGWVAGGGGLILQAGRDYMPEAYRGTRMMTLLPIVPGLMSRFPLELGDRKRFRLTPVGRTHPIMAILKDPVRNPDFWDGDEYRSYFYWYAPAERAKSSATVLAVRRPEGAGYVGPEDPLHPLVALQDYGFGKVLWFGTDELWRMRFQVENLYYWRFWSGAIRHMATYRLLGGNKRVKIFLDRNDGRYRVGDTIEIVAKFLDENFEPVIPVDEDPASQRRTLHLRTPEGDVEEIVLTAVPQDPPQGNYRARIQAARPGTFRLYAEPERDEERAERTIVVEETTTEKRDPLMDWKTLAEIAKESGGEVLTPAEFHTLLKDPRKITPGGILRSGERKTRDLWDRPWLLLLVVGLLAAEWILRKVHLLL